jgi:uncharacterized protein YjaG (DUF416 family)
MILTAFNSEALKERLSRLDSGRQLAFGAACCERLLPNYLAFQQDTGWGDVHPVRDALESVWASIRDEVLSHQEIKNITAFCESAVPDSEAFKSLYVTSAQDACFAVCCLLDFLLESDVNKIVQAATYAIDSVDLYVQEIENMPPNDPKLEPKILAHHLMQRELAQQEENLKMIEQTPFLSHEFLARLKKSWDNNGKSNLDIPSLS